MKFYVGGEDHWEADKVDWVKDTFPEEAYILVDKGWFAAEYYIEFKDDKYAILYKLRWG